MVRKMALLGLVLLPLAGCFDMEYDRAREKPLAPGNAFVGAWEGTYAAVSHGVPRPAYAVVTENKAGSYQLVLKLDAFRGKNELGIVVDGIFRGPIELTPSADGSGSFEATLPGLIDDLESGDVYVLTALQMHGSARHGTMTIEFHERNAMRDFAPCKATLTRVNGKST